MLNLSGRRVLVTGGGTGTGRDMARAYAAAGGEVVICGRKMAPLESVAAETGAVAAECDVTSEAAVDALFAAHGPFDIVIANAGQAESNLVARTPLEQWERIVAVNLTGTFLTFRAAARNLRDPASGRLIAIASVAGLRGLPYAAPYTAAKHGVIGLVRALAGELLSTGTTVNAICPGYLDTEMTARSVENVVAKTGRSAEEARTAIARQNPNGRLIGVEEVTATALWLSDPGLGSVTGQAIAVAGGEV